MTAERGIRAAFELSWQELNAEAQNVGKLLSLFAEDAIPWYLVAEAANLLDWDSATVAESKQKLYQLHLIQLEGMDTFKLHPLIHEFFRLKLAASEQSAEIQRAFVSSLIAVARDIPDTATRSIIEQVTPAIPHLSLVAQNLLPQVEDEDIGDLFIALGRFYQNQGLYKPAEVWYEQGWQQTTARLGSEHPDVATSLNNLAVIYRAQGRYQEAEPLYLQALEMAKRLLGDDHPSVAIHLSNLAELYVFTLNPWKLVKAVFLQIRSLKINFKTLGWRHPHTLNGFGNLFAIFWWGGWVSLILISSTMLFIHTLNWRVLLDLVFFLLWVKVLLRWNLGERLYQKARYKFSKWRTTRKGSAK
jgi:tetratricopeptide (TPR) repeat protein